MVKTLSTMAPIGIDAPWFALPDTNGLIVSLDDLTNARGLLVGFICNLWPYVKHLSSGLADFTRVYMAKDLAVVCISSNDASAYSEDGPDIMARELEEIGYPFPYLYDEDQSVAKAYTAACTPDFFLFNKEKKLVYRGQFDDSRPGNGLPVTGDDLGAAIDALLEGSLISENQVPSLGCNIKWKPGNEPAYFIDSGEYFIS